jgi:hypothetical protein
MSYKIIFSLVEESLSGDVGSEWEYVVNADLMDPMLFGSGSIEVPQHVLRPGNTQVPPNAGRAVMLEAGDEGGEISVRLTLKATEVDFLVDDHGSNVRVVSVECPAPGGDPIASEPDIWARVREAPGFQGGSAVLKVKVRLVARYE